MPKTKQSNKAPQAATQSAEIPKVNVDVVSDKKKPTKLTKNANQNKDTKDTKDTKENSDVILTKTPVVEANEIETTTDQPDQLLTDTFSGFLQKLQALTTQMNLLKTEFRTLEKKATRELKAAQKVNAKRKRKSGNRSPSGFVKPTLISDELAKFLQKPTGTEMARTEVTREINSYIRSNNLQDKANGRKINPDTQLANLLKIQNGDELTYFNLQRYMSPHFAKAGQTKV
tara:strand:+ start:159 stop:848 length:690 start_codon:yes stop_codon:yes gene_type:complete